MNLSHDFVAERALAQHCAELVPPAVPGRDMLAECSLLARDIAAELAECMACVAVGGPISVSCTEPVRQGATAFIKKSPRQTAHCVIDLEGSGSILLSVEHGAALALTDRAYGGNGDLPDPLPETLPMSSDMTLHQLEAVWCSGIARVMSARTPCTVARRGADLARLDPFRGHSECVHVKLNVAQDDHAPWIITLTISMPDLDHLLAHRDRSASTACALRAASDGTAEPFADITLAARAVLAQMPVSLARASTLAPGDIIPLAIGREVPLEIGGLTVCFGTVGAVDDRIAIQVTRPFPA